MKKTLRSLSLIMAFCLMATVVPLIRGGGMTAFADSAGDFTVVNGELTNYTGTDATVYIPEGVTEIRDTAFSNSNQMTRIVIPSSLTYVSGSAFDPCTVLKEIQVASSNTYFSTDDDGVLYNYDKTKIVRYPAGKTDTSYTISSSVTIIGASAFYHAGGLTEVSVPSGVTSIGAFAFCWMGNLTSITVPEAVTFMGLRAISSNPNMKHVSINAKNPTFQANDLFYRTTVTDVSYAGNYSEWNSSLWKNISALNADTVDKYFLNRVENRSFKGFTASEETMVIAPFVTRIEKDSFAEYNGMESLTLPDDLTYFHKDVFDPCTNLQSLTISSDNAKYKTVDGVLYTKDGKTLVYYPQARPGTSFIVPSTVTQIGYSAFFKNANLTSVTMNAPVNEIGSYAFDASHLTTIDIPSSVTTVKTRAFAFMKNTISKVIIRAKNATVSSDAFYSDTITNVYYGGSATDWDGSQWKTALDGKYQNKSHWFVITDGKLTDYLGEDVENLSSIPTSVTEITATAFRHATNLKTVIIPSSVTTISTSAFDPCKALTAFYVNENNTAFRAVDGVLYTKDGTTLFRYPIARPDAAFTVPTDVTTIGNSAFYWVRNLETVTLPSGLTGIEAYGFDSCPKIKVLTIPAAVDSIGYRGLGYLTGLKYLNIHAKNPTTISTNAFTGTAGITDITYIDTLTEWKASNWYSVDNLQGKTQSYVMKVKDYTLLAYTGTNYTINLPRFVTYMEDHSLPDTLTSVILPRDLADFNRDLFDDLVDIASINVQSGSTHFKSENGVLYSYDGKTLERYPLGRTDYGYTVPSGVTTIAESAFYKCSWLKDVTVPASVTTIGNYAFAGTLKFNDITIRAINPTIASNAIGSTKFTNVHYYGTMEEWDASSWKTALSGKYTNLILESDLTITQQPQDQTVAVGGKATFTVAATGDSLTYQWYYKKSAQSSWSVWSGRTSATASITTVASWDGAKVYCKITDGSGHTLDSATATVTVN